MAGSALEYRLLPDRRSSRRWSLCETIALQTALGIPTGPTDPAASVRDLLRETRTPEEIEQPLVLSVDGSKPSSLLMRSRGFFPEGTRDLIVDEKLFEILSAFALPSHETIACEVVKGRERVPFRWLWWTESFQGQLDLPACGFEMRHSDGSSEKRVFADIHVYADALRESTATGDFDVIIRKAAWCDPRLAKLDLFPFDRKDVFLSQPLADALQKAPLHGFEVVPSR